MKQQRLWIPLPRLLCREILKNSSKRTALVIAHRLATIESSDKILVLKGGSLVEEGTHSELRLKKGLYFQLSELQQRIREFLMIFRNQGSLIKNQTAYLGMS